MSASSAIGWTNATWNPTVGCSKVSTGCRECYAEDVHEQRLNGVHGYPTFKPWTTANAEHNVTLMPHKLRVPLTWRKPRMVFVNSMSDLFHEQVPDEYIDRVFATMGWATQHTFQILTKRPERMRDYLMGGDVEDRIHAAMCKTCCSPGPGCGICEWPGDDCGLLGIDWPLPNVWAGVSIENRKWVGRADILRDTPAAVRFISAEPLLGPLVATDDSDGLDQLHGPGLDLTGIDWLIVGGESGPNHRPMDLQWMRDLRDACAATGACPGCNGSELPTPCYRCGGRAPRQTAFFAKQIASSRPGVDPPGDLLIREFPAVRS